MIHVVAGGNTILPAFTTHTLQHQAAFMPVEQGDDSTKQKQSPKILPDPRGSMYKSLILPGLGQAANRQYWKIPVIYAGFGVSVYALVFANTRYIDFKKAYIYRTDNDPATMDKYHPDVVNDSPKYTESQLKLSRDYYRRNVEISVLATAGIYLVNVIDAYVSAQLLRFDVSDDLSIHFSPALYYNIAGKPFLSTGLLIDF